MAAHVLQAHLTQANEGDGAGVSRGQPGSLGLMANHECCIVKVFTQVTACNGAAIACVVGADPCVHIPSSASLVGIRAGEIV